MAKVGHTTTTLTVTKVGLAKVGHELRLAKVCVVKVGHDRRQTAKPLGLYRGEHRTGSSTAQRSLLTIQRQFASMHRNREGSIHDTWRDFVFSFSTGISFNDVFGFARVGQDSLVAFICRRWGNAVKVRRRGQQPPQQH